MPVSAVCIPHAQAARLLLTKLVNLHTFGIWLWYGTCAYPFQLGSDDISAQTNSVALVHSAVAIYHAIISIS